MDELISQTILEPGKQLATYQSNCKLQVLYYMSTKTKFNVIYYNHMFHSHS